MRIGLLGTLQVHDDAGQPVRVGGHRVRMLLILLALDPGRVVPSYSLIERLWGPAPPADAGNALQTLVSRLRAALRASLGNGVIESHPAGYRLVVPPEAVDAVAFEARARAGAEALRSGDAATAARVLREALGEWRGPALTDAASEAFAAGPAARLEELRTAATLDRIEADLALGVGASLVGELRAMVGDNPLAERSRALLMRALYAAGRQADALAVYQEARELLASQLGVDPSAELEQVYMAILRQEVPLPAPAVATPPAADADHAQDAERGVAPPQGTPRRPGGSSQLTSFVGRDEDMSMVLKKLGEERLVTLTGPGGVGKTRLATEVATRLGTAAWLAELAPVTDPAEVPHAVLDALGIRERVIARRAAEPGSPVERLVASLAHREIVLIMDNCEHVIEAAAELADRVLAGCPKVSIVATSREPLRIGGETLWLVSALPVPPLATSPLPAEPVFALASLRPAAEDASVISAYPSVRLLRDRAAAVLPGFAVDASNADDVARICRALDGMPLAIELAAVWLRTLSPAQLAERLDDRFALLTSGSRTALPRHQTLRAVVDWSWELLSEPERVLARRLSIFPGGTTLAGAEHVCADNPSDQDGRPLLRSAVVLPTLAGLVDKSILVAEAAADGSSPRYRMLETVRAYGQERLAQAGEDVRVRNAFTTYYLNLAETADPLLRTAQQGRWLRELAAEQDNMHAAVRWAIARRDAESALRFVRALSWYWMVRGQGEDALAREVLALEPPEPTPLIAEARVICAVTGAGQIWDMEPVRPALNAALADLAKFAGERPAFNPVAAMAEPMLALFDRDTDRALALLEPHISSADPWERAVMLLARSSLRAMRGDAAGAREDSGAALAGFRATGEAWGAAVTQFQRAEFAEQRGDHATAIAALEEARSCGRDLGAWGDLAHIDGKLAAIHIRTGDFARAREELRLAGRVPAAAQHDNELWYGFVRAELTWREGDVPGAASQCTELLAKLENEGAVWWDGLRAQTRARLAVLALEAGDEARCRALLADALRGATHWVELPILATVMDAAAVLALRSGGHPDGAEQAARLLGAAHSVRGAFDEASLDAPAVRESARRALGASAFDAAYASGRELGHEEAVALAEGLTSAAG
jgi:predicted ATPase/DNA-binding SARP family transcriptional activator